MVKNKALRNRTIDTPLSEGENYLRRCIRVDSPQHDLSYVLDKTIHGNSFEVLPFLPRSSVNLIIADPPYNLTKLISTRLCSMFNRQLLRNTKIMKQWAGRNSRGGTQFVGKALEAIVTDFDPSIDVVESKNFLIQCLNC